jgi:hypothetical protein
VGRPFLITGLIAFVVTACSPSNDRTSSKGPGGTGGGGGVGQTIAGGGGAGGEALGGQSGGGAAGAGSGGGTAGTGSGGATAGASGSTTDADAGGPTDAGAEAGSGVGDGASGCPYVLCESFAGAAPGTTGSAWSYDVDKSGTVAEIVSDKGRTDEHSLHIKASSMGGIHGYITESETLTKTGGSFWGRAFIWYMLDVPGVHIVNVALDGKMANASPEQLRLVNVIGSHICTNRRSDDMSKCSNVGPDQAKWGCYEWHVTPGNIDVYLDGTLLPISEAWALPTMSLLRVGFERFSAGAAGDLWIDDVAIDGSRVGCD